MKVAGKHVIPVKSLDAIWHLAVISDVHLGNRAASLGTFRAVVQEIARTKNCGVILLGDQIDAIGPGDKRFDADVLDPETLGINDLANLGEVLIDAFVEEVKPIRSKIFAACMGNHEYQYMRRHAQSHLHPYMCRKLDCIDLGYSGFIDLVFEDPQGKRSTFRVRAHHGAGAAQTDGGKMMRLVKFVKQCEADIILTGHTHDDSDKTIIRLAANRDCTKLAQIRQHGFICGTFKRTYAQDVLDYSEIRGYDPTSLGSLMLEIRPARRLVDKRWLRG